MAARVDIKQYYQGVSVGDNVQFLPQGGVKRRPGLKYIAEPTGNGRLVPFVFNTDQKYLLCFSDLLVEIYRTDTDTLVDTVVTPYTTANLFNLDYAQTADTMIITHEDYQPRTLVRGATDADFTLATITMDETAQYDFNDASSPTAVSEIQTIDFGNGWNEGDTFKLTLEGVDTASMPFLEDGSAVNIADMNARIATELQDLSITASTGITVTHTGTDDLYTVTFADASAYPWQKIGVRSIDAVQDPTTNTTAVGRTQTGVARSEDVWSAGRGWPRTVTFFEGRLWFGGSASRPHTVWGSRVNNFYNFDPGKSRADQAIDVTLDTDQINRIQSIVGGRNLQIYTIGGEYVFKKATSDPITPENVQIESQTSYGSKRITPVAVGGAQMFIQRTGKAVREFLFNFDESAYDSTSLTLLAPNVIVDPIDMQVQRGTTSDDATYVFMTNTDGTLAVFNTAKAENVAAWSLWNTSGSFKSVAVVLDELYVLVSRSIDSVTRYYIEKADNDSYTDSAKHYTSPGTSLTSLDHLDGEEVRVVVDDYKVLPNETVPSSTPWTVTLPYSVTTAEAGLNFDVTLTTMPIVQDQGGGHDMNDEKRVSRVTLELFESLGVKVEGYTLDMAKTAVVTGRESIVLMGWSNRPTITITQTDPLPMTVLGISMEVNG